MGGLTMKFEDLHSLYLHELKDLYDAEKRIVKALPKIIEASNSQPLRTALSNHLEETKGHVTRLEQVFQLHNEKADTEKCKGMSGILDEGEDILGHDENVDVRDAGIIAGAQKVEHYEMAGYGTVIAWARQMGHSRAAQILEQTLNEEKNADAKLTEISKTLNVEAVRRAG